MQLCWLQGVANWKCVLEEQSVLALGNICSTLLMGNYLSQSYPTWAMYVVCTETSVLCFRLQFSKHGNISCSQMFKLEHHDNLLLLTIVYFADKFFERKNILYRTLVHPLGSIVERGMCLERPQKMDQDNRKLMLNKCWWHKRLGHSF